MVKIRVNVPTYQSNRFTKSPQYNVAIFSHINLERSSILTTFRKSQMEWAYRHIAEEFAKHFLERNIITFNIRKAYNNEVMLEGEMYVGVKQERQ